MTGFTHLLNKFITFRNCFSEHVNRFKNLIILIIQEINFTLNKSKYYFGSTDFRFNFLDVFRMVRVVLINLIFTILESVLNKHKKNILFLGKLVTTNCGQIKYTFPLVVVTNNILFCFRP